MLAAIYALLFTGLGLIVGLYGVLWLDQLPLREEVSKGSQRILLYGLGVGIASLLAGLLLAVGIGRLV